MKTRTRSSRLPFLSRATWTPGVQKSSLRGSRVREQASMRCGWALASIRSAATSSLRMAAPYPNQQARENRCKQLASRIRTKSCGRRPGVDALLRGRATLIGMSETARIELEAVYQAGVFRPSVSPALPDGARVHLVIEAPAPASADPLRLVGAVYDGLTPAEVAEIEAISLDRTRFLGR